MLWSRSAASNESNVLDLFFLYCHAGSLPESAWIHRRRRKRLQGFAPGAGGRREVIRERLSSRHCEELKNADGPPDKVAW